MKTRNERTELCYRQAMRTALLEMLKIINPEDQITYGSYTYEDLIIYARDWLQTEVDEVLGKAAEPAGLSLE